MSNKNCTFAENEYGMLRKALMMIVFTLLGISSACRAQQTGDSIPDFKQCFEILIRNRDVYNQYNDSIFLIKDHDKWVNFFRLRAIKNHQIFASNKEALRTITDYFEQDYSKIPLKAYNQLMEAFYDIYIPSKKSDPFIRLTICQMLEKYAQHVPDSINYSNYINLWLGTIYSEMWSLGKDIDYLKTSYEYEKKVASDEANRYPYYLRTKAYALCNLTGTAWLSNGIQTIDEYRKYRLELRRMMNTPSIIDSLPENIRKDLRSRYSMLDEALVRNVYLTDSNRLDKQQADSLLKVVVKRNLANRQNLSHASYIRTLVMEMKLNQLTGKEAWQRAIAHYNHMWKDIKSKHMNEKELRDYIRPFYTFFYINDVAEIPLRVKRNTVVRMCKDIETAYMNSKDQQLNNTFVRDLNTLTTYVRITKYLKPKERIHFLNTLNVATQVTTYAHSVHVSMIAKELMEGILKYQPSLLVGTFGYNDVATVKKHRKYYLDFIHDAAMYHDLGKNSIITVVNNDYRPLTDEEFTIIKRHPEYGLQYLELSPDLAKFHDTTLGHHKWYNGKGGYLTWFDNTQSPIRIMIDIVTLSDCMQAATERIGRNYKGDKNFETVMAEFRRDAGTRYNPNLVKFIDQHEDIANKLAALINEGWVDIYYDIYSQYIHK